MSINYHIMFAENLIFFLMELFIIDIHLLHSDLIIALVVINVIYNVIIDWLYNVIIDLV